MFIIVLQALFVLAFVAVTLFAIQVACVPVKKKSLFDESFYYAGGRSEIV